MTKAGPNKSASVLALLTPSGIAKALDIPESEGTRLLDATLSRQPGSATSYGRCCAILAAVEEVLNGKTVDEVVIAQPQRPTEEPTVLGARAPRASAPPVSPIPPTLRDGVPPGDA